MKVLIIEDQPELAENMAAYLSREGYVCSKAVNYQDAEQKLFAFEYDVIIVDIMLPDGTGLDLINFIRTSNKRPGILIVSAKNSLTDKVIGLDLGADDYLTKPFYLPELHSRLKAIYRRRNLLGEQLVQFNEISINTENREVIVGENLLELTKKEYELVLYFLVNQNRILTRQSIAEHLWGDYTDNLDNIDFVYQHIKNLRKKIIAAGGKDYISTVYGVGYKLDQHLQ